MQALNLPMALTFMRVVVLLPIAGALALGWDSVALVLFVVAALTDWADGWVARYLGQTTRIGAIADQIADKIFVIGCLVILAWDERLESGFAIVPALILIAREFGIAGLREYAPDVVPVGFIGKVKTATAMMALFAFFIPTFGVVGAALLWLAAIFGLISALSYVRRMS